VAGADLDRAGKLADRVHDGDDLFERRADDQGNAVMQDGANGAAGALRWLVDAVQTHKILSPSCVETGELAGLKAFSSGDHAFGLIPKYRLRTLNDPAQSKIAGNAKIALMPKGDTGSHATVGWMRFYGMTPRAQADAVRADETVKLMAWFGGKADGEYKFQKMPFKDVGSGFGVKSLFNDPEIRAAYAAYGDVDLIGQQQSLARKTACPPLTGMRSAAHLLCVRNKGVARQRRI
jgi:multiple sugar transport system substrate-binding protein